MGETSGIFRTFLTDHAELQIGCLLLGRGNNGDDTTPAMHNVRIMPLLPSFSSISPIYCKTSCPRHDIKLHNYALTITTTTCGTCLWSRYPVLVIIRELEALNFKALHCQLTTIGDSGYQQHGMSTLSQRTSSTTNTLLP